MSPFFENAPGVNTNRDSWAISFSKAQASSNMKRLISNYNEALRRKQKDTDVDNIKWSAGLKRSFKKGIELKFDERKLVKTLYRPFTKKWMYYDHYLTERPGKYIKKWGNENCAIITSGRGATNFDALISNLIPNLNCLTATQGFMKKQHEIEENLFSSINGINPYFTHQLGLSDDDTFAYIYGLLNSREYRSRYSNDLKKELARIPIVKNIDDYVTIGKKLMKLHLNYEQVPVYDGVKIQYRGTPDYRVNKMDFARLRNQDGKRINDYSTIIFNDTISISNIPEEAYEYVINGFSAIEWIMKQYRISKDNDYNIIDDPNDYSDDPKYIFNLLLRIINVSVQTVDLINQLPKFEIDESYYQDKK